MQFFVNCIFLTIFLENVEGNFRADPPYYAQVYAHSIPFPRVIVVDETGDIIIATREEESRLYLLYEVENSTDKSIEVVTQILLDAPSMKLGHGLAFNKGYLYAPSTSEVYRWAYTPGQRTSISPLDAQTIVSGIPGGGTHMTRSIVFGLGGDLLYVQVGSLTDVDPDSSRSKILQFNMSSIPLGGFQYEDAVVFAEGTRNTVGLGFDLKGVLWGIDNGVNFPSRPDIEQYFEEGNPAEELNRFGYPPGAHFGFPYCLSTYSSANSSINTNTQLAYSTFMNDGIHTDEWCANVSNNQPPILAMPAHTAPISIEFYNRTEACNSAVGAFPCEMIGDLFVSFHAQEWLLNPTVIGNRVSQMPIDSITGLPTGEYNTIIYEENLAEVNCGGYCFRPAHAAFTKNGHMIITSDWAFSVFRVTYRTPPPTITKHTFKH